MAEDGVKISELVEKTTLSGTEYLPVQDGEDNKKMKTDLFQKKLVSGTDIKTFNGESLLGSGNISIDATLDKSSNNAIRNSAVATKIEEITTDTDAKITELEEKVEGIKDISSSAIFTDRLYLQANEAVSSVPFGSTASTDISSVTDFIDISEAQGIIISVFKSDTSTNNGCVFYDENKKPVKGYTFPNQDEKGTYILQIDSIPTEYKYVRTGILTSEKSSFTCKLIIGNAQLDDIYGELDKIENSIYEPLKFTINNASYKNNCGIVADDTLLTFGKTGSSSILKSTDYISCKNSRKIRIDNVLYASNTSFGVVFYNEDKTPVKGYKFKTSGDGTYKVQKEDIDSVGYSFFRCSALMEGMEEQEISIYYNTVQDILDKDTNAVSIGSDIYIAASDSSTHDKAMATFICDGINDEEEFNKACAMASGNFTIHLAQGNYYVDSFFDAGDGTPLYVFKPPYSNGQLNLNIVCDNNKNIKTSGGTILADDIAIGAIIRISESCFNTLSDDKKYSIIRCSSNGGGRPYPFTFLNVNGVGFKLPDNNKPITCIDGYYATAMDIRYCTFHAIKNSSDLQLGNMDCIAVKGLQGANYGAFNYVVSCIAWGFGQGFALAGEHLYAEQCLARFCRYGYTFNNFEHPSGNYAHGMFIINCADELGFNMPLLGDNNSNQPIYMIGFNMEWDVDYYNKFEGEGHLMTESTPGSWRGSISYTMTSKHTSFANSTIEPIWANDGSGVNVKSVNDAQKIKCDSITRQSYAPNVGQIIYDTTLNKPVICIDANQKKWIDFNGQNVE